MQKHLYHPFLPKKFPVLCFLLLVGLKGFAQSISATTYPFSVQTGIAPEDMSNGTTLLIGPASDNNTTGLLNIGFDFWFAGTRYTQYSISTNGYIRLGSLIASPGTATDITNNLASFNQAPCIAPYWDDIRTGVIDGKVHVKTTGTAPNRKLVIEWFNVEIPKFEGILNRQFQLWLSETTGKIEFVYGRPGVEIPTNANTGGASIGFTRTSTVFASVSNATSTVSYTSANNGNASPISEGTRYAFTPLIPNTPSDISFTGITGTGISVGWTDNATNEVGYAIYRSDDGGNTFQFITQVAANTVSYQQTLLTPGTTYFWKIYAVTDGGVSNALEGSQATTAQTAITSNGTGGGNWSNTATWTGGVVPGDASNVIIKDGDLVTIDIGANAYNLQIGEGNSGALQFEAATPRTATIFNNLDIKSGGVLQTSGSGNVTTHVLHVNGSLANQGTLDLAVGSTGASLRFSGSNHANFTGGGTVTNLFNINISKQTIEQVVEMNLTNFSVRGLTTNVTGGFLTITSGTFKISGSNTFSGTLTSSAPFSLAAAGYLWLNNPNFSILGQTGDLTVLGTLRISQGTFNVGTALNHSMVSTSLARLIVEGGALNIAGRCSTTAVINISGGIVNVCTVGNNTSLPSFDMPGGTLNLSGGQIRLVKLNSSAAATRFDYSCAASVTRNFTGGKLVLGAPGQTTPLDGLVQFYISGTTPTVELSEGIAELYLRTKGDVNTYGDLIIPANGNLQVSSVFYNLFDGTLTNNGNIYVNASSAGGLVFTGTGAGVYYRGSGRAAPNNLPLSRVYVNHPVGLFIDPTTTNNLVITNFFITRGSVFNAGKITMGAANSCTVTIGAASGTGIPGNFDVPPTFNLGASGSQFLEYLATAGSRAMGNEVNPTRVVSNLTLNSAGNTITMAGGNLQVTGTLALTNGNINLNGDTLTIGSSTASTGTLNATSATAVLYNGKLRRWLPNNSSTARVFPVGTRTTRRNASIAFTTLPTTGGTLTAEFIEGSPAGTGLPLTEGDLTVNSTSDAGYWRINGGDGLTGGAYTATLTASGITGVTDFTKLVMVKRANNASPWLLDGTHVTTTGSNASPVLSRTGMSGFSEFGIGLPGAAVPLTTTWTGAVDTDWFNAANWSNGVPGAISMVNIPPAKPRYPVINTNITIKKITIENGAEVTCGIGVQITITGND